MSMHLDQLRKKKCDTKIFHSPRKMLKPKASFPTTSEIVKRAYKFCRPSCKVFLNESWYFLEPTTNYRAQLTWFSSTFIFHLPSGLTLSVSSTTWSHFPLLTRSNQLGESTGRQNLHRSYRSYLPIYNFHRLLKQPRCNVNIRFLETIAVCGRLTLAVL